MKSIKSKFLAIAISGFLIIAGAIGLSAFLLTNQLLHEKAHMLLEARCASEAAAFNTILGDIQKSVQIMEWYCTDELEGASALTDPAYEKAYTTQMLEMHTTIAQHTSSTAAYYLRYNPELVSPTAGYFINRTADGSSFSYSSATDLSLYSPEDMQRVGWYYTPVSAGKPVWLAPYHNLNNDVLMVSYVIPLYADNTLVGVVGMDIDFTLLQKAVDSISIYDNGIAYLTAADGSIVHTSAGSIDHGQCVEASAALINGMNLVLHADYEDIVRESQPIITRSILILIVLLVLFTLFIIRLTSRITEPLNKLTLAVQQMEAGKTDVEIDCSSNDEIGVLAHAFKRAAEQVHHRMTSINNLSFRDSLTGVKSRLAYVNAVADIDQRISEGGISFGVIVLDANGLKNVNDQYGHDAGDAFIRHIAQILCDVFAHSPVFRFGGDEFVVILENRDLENHEALLIQLEEAYAAAPYVLPNARVPVVVACGTSFFDPQTDKMFNDVFVRADQIMYENKRRLKALKA